MGLAIKTPCLGRESPFVLHDDIIVTFPPWEKQPDVVVFCRKAHTSTSLLSFSLQSGAALVDFGGKT